ncbi:MAG: hypothetical protein DRJ31_11080, partial [Candidatus Methanomethylicota archaeon]
MRKAVILWSMLLIPGILLACGGIYTCDSGGMPTGPIYSTSEIIYLTGDLDRTNPPYEIYPTADVYIIHNDGRDGNSQFGLYDVEGAYNTVIGTSFPGAFIAEPIALPYIPQGEYDVVVDEDQDLFYDPGIDCLCESGSSYLFKVVDTGEPPAHLAVEVANIKARAAERAEDAHTARRNYNLGIAVASYASMAMTFWTNGPTLVSWLTAAGTVMGVAMDYNGAVTQIGTQIINGLLQAQQDHWAGIAADPPDSNYKIPAKIGELEFNYSPIDREYTQHLYRFGQIIGISNGALEALLTSIERFQGAENDHNDLYKRMQAKGIVKYGMLAKQANTLAQAELDTFRQIILAQGLDRTLSPSVLQSAKERVASSGLTTSEIENLSNNGFTAAQVDSVEQALLNIDTTGVYDGNFSDLIDELSSRFLDCNNSLDSIIADAQEVVDSLSCPAGEENAYGSPDYQPIAVITGDSLTPVGDELILSSLASVDNYGITERLWDTNGDGVFDDFATDTILFVTQQAGYHLIGLKVTNTEGYYDYAYHILEATHSNSAPQLTSVTPDTNLVTLIYGTDYTFTVSATDPESEPLNCSWYLDSVLVDSDFSYSYLPTSEDIGSHLLRAIVSDTSSLSEDAGAQWLVYVVEASDVPQEKLTPETIQLELYPNPFNTELNVIIISSQ